MSQNRSNLRFEQRIEQVRHFCRENGHGWIPARYDTVPPTSFGQWANTMRHKHKQQKLPEDRILDLQRAGFLFARPKDTPPIRVKKLSIIQKSHKIAGGSNESLHDGNVDSVAVTNGDLSCVEKSAEELPPEESLFALCTLDHNKPTTQNPRQISARPEGYPVSTDSLEALIQRKCRFGAILADPPWKYQNTVSNGAAEKHYPTMGMDDLKAMPVPELALGNAYLFLWATSPLLKEAIELLEAWGFDYKTHMIWGKPVFGMGNYWRSAHELLLLGVRGKPAPWYRHDISSWVVYPRSRHSAKPAYFRDMVTSVVDGPYLEMFGREDASGWTTFGNQVQPTLFGAFDNVRAG